MYLFNKSCWSLALVLASLSMYAQFDSLPLEPQRFTTIKTSEGTFMNLDVSPVNSDIVFELLGNIFLLREGEQNAIQLTEGLSWDSYPVFAPNGSRIAFISDRSGEDRIYTMKTDGKEMQQIKTSNPKQGILDISWIRNGEQLFDNYFSGVLKLPGDKFFSATSKRKKLNFIRDENKIYIVGKHKDSTLVYSLPLNSTTTNLQVSPNGNYIAYVTLNSRTHKNFVDNELFIINTLTGKPIFKKKIGKYLFHFPNFGFNRHSNKLIIGYKGKIHELDFKTHKDNVIPFNAQIKMSLAGRASEEFSIANDSIQIKRFRWVQPYKNDLLFSSLGKLYQYSNGKARKLMDNTFYEYFPVVSAGKEELFFTSWNKDSQGFIWKLKKNGCSEKVVDEPGLYKQLTLNKYNNQIAYLKIERNWKRFEENRDTGVLYVQDLNSRNQDIFENAIPVQNSISFGKGGGVLRYLSALEPGSYYRNFTELNMLTGKRRPIARMNPNVHELIINQSETFLAFVYHYNLYLLDLRNRIQPYSLVNENDISQAVKISYEGVTDPRFVDDQTVVWSQGSAYHEFKINQGKGISKPPIQKNQKLTHLIQYKDVERGENIKALTGGRIITMNKNSEILNNGTILIENDRIIQVGMASEVQIPEKAEVFQLNGKTIIPGFIDMHAHDGPPDDVLEFTWARFVINLAYGITTIRDPSVNPDYYVYSYLSETGQLVAPRLLGARALTNTNYEINEFQDALNWVKMQKSLGTTYIKVHDSWNRKQRQYLVKAAREQNLNIIGHPDSYNYSGRFNLSILLDGFTTWEHSIPFGKLYSDVRQLITYSQTGYTLTGINNGGEFYRLKQRAIENKDSDINLCLKDIYRQFTLHSIVPDESMLMPYVKDAYNIGQMGGHILVGSHGDIPGLEFHWELWSFQEGGMAPMEAIEAGTIEAARSLGMQKDLGSLEPGKIADLVVLNKNPKEDIKFTLDIFGVMKNGQFFPRSELLESCQMNYLKK